MAIALVSSISNLQEWLQFGLAACLCGVVFWRTGLGSSSQNLGARLDASKAVRRSGKVLLWPDHPMPRDEAYGEKTGWPERVARN